MLSLNSVGSTLPWLLAGCQALCDSIDWSRSWLGGGRTMYNALSPSFSCRLLAYQALQPQTHLWAAAGHYALCRSSWLCMCVCVRACASVHFHNLVGAAGMLKALIISMENVWLLTRVMVTCQPYYVLSESIGALGLNCAVMIIKVRVKLGCKARQ